MKESERFAKQYNVTVEEASAELAQIAKELRASQRKAEKATDGKYRGFTAEYLAQNAARYERYAAGEE